MPGPIATPTKPFPGYKWRWAVLTPTEGLNAPPVFHGVLRVWARFEGQPPNSLAVTQALARVEADTGTGVNLRRTPERNLLRNSGQYWKAMGLIGGAHGMIELTPFGRRVASGAITPTEFAFTIVRMLTLPNPRIEDPTPWSRAGLTVRPLALIVDILRRLSQLHGSAQGYITPNELIRVVIPLAGESRSIDEHVAALAACIALRRHGRNAATATTIQR